MKTLSLPVALVGLLVAGPALAQSPGVQLASDDAATQQNVVDITLTEAYKREFAFLAGQKKQLEKRLDTVTRKAAEREAARAADIEQLENRLLALEAKTQQRREALERAQRLAQSSTDDSTLVEATLQQARTTLLDYDVEVPEASDEASPSALLAGRFDTATALLDRLSSVHTQEGSFFRKDGTKVDGRIVYVGRIAAFGVSEQAAGALAPVGGGKLKIWRDAAEADARALVKGERPERLSVFLYESLDARVDDDEGETTLEHVASGGAIGWVIVALGALGFLLAGARALLLSRASASASRLESEVGGHVRAGHYSEALAAAERGKGAAARVLAAVIPTLSRGSDDVEDVFSESLLNENRRIHRFSAMILVVAAVAPLLGLLGTVTGMISTFDVITKYGTGDPKLLSGGISTALVTTELGLIVAIPTLLLGNLLKGWGDGIESEVERVVLRIVNIHKEARKADEVSAAIES